MTQRNWHGRCRPLSNSPEGSANGTRLRITTKPHQHHYAFIIRVSCCCLTPKFTYRDIRELQWKKTVAYAKALQFWAEKANLPTQGQPCLLVGSIVELREEMKFSISFTDEDIFSSVALLEEFPVTQTKEATSKGPQPTQADSSVREATAEVSKEPTREKKPLNCFLVGRRCYTPPGW